MAFITSVVGGLVKPVAQVFGLGPIVCVLGHEHNSEKEAKACNDAEENKKKNAVELSRDANRHQATMQKEILEAERIKATEEQQTKQAELRVREKELELEAKREENRHKEELRKAELEAQKRKEELEAQRSRTCVIL